MTVKNMGKRLKDFQKAITKLEEVLKLAKNEVIRDSAIMRFQFVFDLCWKVLKDCLGKKGVECYSPRDCFKGAFSPI